MGLGTGVQSHSRAVANYTGNGNVPTVRFDNRFGDGEPGSRALRSVVLLEWLEQFRQQFRGDTGPYLTPAPGKASLNLLKMLREGLLVGVRGALHKARREETPGWVL